MLKQRIIRVIVSLALLVALTGGAGIVADALGLPATPQIHACTGGGGGNC